MSGLIFGLGFPMTVVMGTVLAVQFPRVRDLMLFATVFSTTMVYMLDINFFGRYWYRGTTLGIEFSFLDAFVLILLFTALLTHSQGRTPWFWPPALGWMLVYLAYCTLKVMTQTPMIYGTWELAKIFRGVLAFIAMAYAVRNTEDLKIVAYGCAAAVGFEFLHAVNQRYRLGLYRVGATLDHPNNLSMFSCMIVPVLLAVGMSRTSRLLQACCWAAAPLAVLCVVFTVSRTGFVVVFFVSAVTLAVVTRFRITPKRIALAIILAIGAAGIVYKSWDTMMERFGGLDLSEEFAEGQGTEKYQGRGMYFELARAIVSDNPLGIGLNNWSYYVSNQYGPMLGYYYRGYEGTDVIPDRTPVPGSNLMSGQAAPAHNLLALTTGELGWPGLALFLCAWFAWLRMCIPFVFKRDDGIMSRIAIGFTFGLLAVFLQALTEWIFRFSAIFFMAHFYAGILSRLYYHEKQRRARARAA